jgi:hypothetical protein
LDFEKKMILNNFLIYKSPDHIRIQIFVIIIGIYNVELNFFRTYKYILIEPNFIKLTKNQTKIRIKRISQKNPKIYTYRLQNSILLIEQIILNRQKRKALFAEEIYNIKK